MLHWLRYPFVRLTPAFVVGILCYEVLEHPGYNWIILLALFIFLLVVLVIATGTHFFSMNPIAGSAALGIMLVAGYLSASLHYELDAKDHFNNRSFTHYQGVVESWPEERGNFFRFILKVDKVKDSLWIGSEGKVQVYIPKNEFQPLSYGSILVVRGFPSETGGPRNPFEFDYKRYLARKNIFHQHFLKSNDYYLAGQSYPSWLKAQTGIIRNKADSLLESEIQSPEELSLARAMLLGIRSGMDSEMRSAYSHAGAMHILAISGLHVGIIYGFLALLFSPLKGRKHGKIIVSGAILLILWFYAFLVGMSPSVMRATVMFSLIAIGQAFLRTPDIFNTIAFSAFLLLAFDPFQLFALGFQLSYLAVIGIVLIFRNINSWVSSKYWLINKAWAVTSVAIAAQLMTFPLALYYFHNFPNMFFLSNLVVIPAAFLILISGISFLLASILPVAFLAKIFSTILSFTLGVMNKSVLAIEGIPYSHVSSISLPGHLAILLYLIIICLLAAFLMRRVGWFYMLAVLWIGFSVGLLINQTQRSQRQLLMIYDISRKSVIDVVDSGEITSSVPDESEKEIQYQVGNFRVAMVGGSMVSTMDFRESEPGVKMYSTGGKSLVWINDEMSAQYKSINRLDIDFLLISNNSIKDFERLLEIFNPGLIILDSSNDYYYSNRAKNQLQEMEVEVYDTRKSGGLLLNLSDKNL